MTFGGLKMPKCIAIIIILLWKHQVRSDNTLKCNLLMWGRKHFLLSQSGRSLVTTIYSCTVRVKELYLKATLNLSHYLIPHRDSKDLMEIHLYRKKSWNCKWICEGEWLKYQVNRCSMCENPNCFGKAFKFDRQNPSGSKFPKI